MQLGMDCKKKYMWNPFSSILLQYFLWYYLALVLIMVYIYFLSEKDSFATIQPVWDKSLVNFQKAIKMFEGFGDKNTAGHNCVNVAYLYVLAAAAVVNDSPSDLFPAQEKEYLSKVGSHVFATVLF